MHSLDHLVYAVPDLPSALNWFEEHTGLRPAIGGRHPQQGTHNALVNIGNGAYLEIVAIDPENTDIPPPRWMGVDHISAPTMVRWSLKSDNLPQQAALLQDLNPSLGTIHTGQRKTPAGDHLQWQMTLPLPNPAVDIIPFFLDWSASDFHPTDRMEEAYSVLHLELAHPEPAAVAAALSRLGVNTAVVLADQPGFTVRLMTPKGEVVLR